MLDIVNTSNDFGKGLVYKTNLYDIEKRQYLIVSYVEGQVHGHHMAEEAPDEVIAERCHFLLQDISS